jgi:hypothetical protein
LNPTPPVARVWRGVARADAASAYVEHLHSATFPKLRGLAGYRRAWSMRREIAQGVEFLVVTTWDSMEAVERFAGPTPDLAVVPPEARALLVEFDEHARHFELIG